MLQNRHSRAHGRLLKRNVDALIVQFSSVKRQQAGMDLDFSGVNKEDEWGKRQIKQYKMLIIKILQRQKVSMFKRAC